MRRRLGAWAREGAFHEAYQFWFEGVVVVPSYGVCTVGVLESGLRRRHSIFACRGFAESATTFRLKLASFYATFYLEFTGGTRSKTRHP